MTRFRVPCENTPVTNRGVELAEGSFRVRRNDLEEGYTIRVESHCRPQVHSYQEVEGRPTHTGGSTR